MHATGSRCCQSGASSLGARELWNDADMDDVFGDSAMAIYGGDVGGLTTLLADDPTLATRISSRGHPTLLQLVACEASQLPDPLGAARVLVAAGAPGGAPLVAAAGCGSQSVLEFLLDEGVDINGETLWTPLDEALYWAQHEIVAFLVDRGAPTRALSTAAGLGDVGAMSVFFDGRELTRGAGPIASPFADTVPAELAHDSQALFDHAFVMAVNCGQRSTAERLLEMGAVVNGRPPGYHWHGTALHAAVWRGDTSLVQWLLAIGADPSIRDGLADSDAVGWATHHGHPDLVEMLTAD